MPEKFDLNIAKEFLSYFPETGDFYWIKRPSNRVKVGMVAGVLSRGYVLIRFKGQLFPAHRLACAFMGLDIEGKEVDHIDGNPSNNRIANLRACSRTDNNRNTRPHRDNLYSKWKGVSWDKRRGKWYARLGRVQEKDKFLGYFLDEREAAEAYIFAALEHHGEFARFE